MANKKSTDAKKAPTRKSNKGPIMCAIPQSSIQMIFDWLNGDEMLMPQNQVRKCIGILNTATIIEDDEPQG